MASRGNPNVPSKLKKKANRSKVQKRNAKKKDLKKSSVFYPTSGSAAPLSGKKAKKLARAQTHTRRRTLEEAMAKEGEVFMTDAPKTPRPKTSKTTDDKMELD